LASPLLQAAKPATEAAANANNDTKRTFFIFVFLLLDFFSKK
jgi:hypothetical protein